MLAGFEREPDCSPVQVFALTILRRPRYRPAKPGANPEPRVLARGSGRSVHQRLHRGNPPLVQPADPVPGKPVSRPRHAANRQQPRSMRSTQVSGLMRGGHAFRRIRTMPLPTASLESEEIVHRSRESGGHPGACERSSKKKSQSEPKVRSATDSEILVMPTRVVREERRCECWLSPTIEQ